MASMSDRDRKILLAIVPVVVIVAYWFLLLAPKREGLHPDYELGYFERTLNEAFEVERTERLESGTRVLYFARPKRG